MFKCVGPDHPGIVLWTGRLSIVTKLAPFEGVKHGARSSAVPRANGAGRAGRLPASVVLDACVRDDRHDGGRLRRREEQPRAARKPRHPQGRAREVRGRLRRRRRQLVRRVRERRSHAGRRLERAREVADADRGLSKARGGLHVSRQHARHRRGRPSSRRPRRRSDDLEPRPRRQHRLGLVRLADRPGDLRAISVRDLDSRWGYRRYVELRGCRRRFERLQLTMDVVERLDERCGSVVTHARYRDPGPDEREQYPGQRHRASGQLRLARRRESRREVERNHPRLQFRIVQRDRLGVGNSKPRLRNGGVARSLRRDGPRMGSGSVRRCRHVRYLPDEPVRDHPNRRKRIESSRRHARPQADEKLE